MLNKSVMHFVVTIHDISYILGSLSINNKKREFSYHFTYPLDSPDYHLNYNSNERTLRMDHITWHADRNQIRLKKPAQGKYPEPISPMNRKFILHQDKGLNTPIEPFYVESIYFNNQKPCLLKQIDHAPWPNSKNQEILNIESSHGFSMILFLVSSSESTDSILQGYQLDYIPDGRFQALRLENLINKYHRAGRILLYDDWDILVVISPFLIAPSSRVPSIMQPAFRIFDFINPLNSLAQLMMVSNECSSQQAD
ncbi:hypothetical protein KBC04_02905 [Candidatus Babeliales bacterium]|nr:hypothetical protein [Candidatus Babeliales bacterium]MBP9843998.1 hypothetical protein [Candidatus Babeliales bacterium]